MAVVSIILTVTSVRCSDWCTAMTRSTLPIFPAVNLQCVGWFSSRLRQSGILGLQTSLDWISSWVAQLQQRARPSRPSSPKTWHPSWRKGQQSTNRKDFTVKNEDFSEEVAEILKMDQEKAKEKARARKVQVVEKRVWPAGRETTLPLLHHECPWDGQWWDGGDHWAN